MIKRFIEWLKEDWFRLASIVCIIVLAVMFFHVRHVDGVVKGEIDEVEYIDSMNNYHKVFYDSKITKLKKENKALYDSIKAYKDKVDFLVQFTYEKDYSSGVVVTKENVGEETLDTMSETYEYTSEPNDTFQYKLRINAPMEPNWYSLDVRTRETFTIVNKKSDGSSLNEMSIDTQGGGDITNVTSFSKEERTRFSERIGIGPTVSVGYDPINNSFGAMVGIGITFNLKKQKR